MAPLHLPWLLSAFHVALAVAEDDDRWATFAQPGWEPALQAEERRAHILHQPLVVILALKQQNVPFLEDRARHVTDPEDESYGQYFSRDEVDRLARPDEEHIRAVAEFLEGIGEGSFTFARGSHLVKFVCKVECIERAFRTKLVAQRSPTKPGHSPFRAGTPIRLPRRVVDALDGVSLNAPIFMPAKPPPREPAALFTYPKDGRTAPRINPQLISGDEFVTVRFVAYCKNGRANEDSLKRGLCSGTSSSGIVSFEIVILQAPSRQKVMQVPATHDLLGERVVSCSEDTPCIEFNMTIGALENYANTTARVRAHFADGTVSPFSIASETSATWPLPYTTPTLLSKIYGVPIGKPVRHHRNSIAVAEFMGQYYNPKDLEYFFHMMGVRSWQGEGRTQPQIVGPDEPQAGSVFGSEAQLDLQYIMAMAPNVTTFFWSVPGIELGTEQEPFLVWLMQLSDAKDSEIPLVHSVSYADDERPMPMWFKRRVNEELMKLALRGVSILVASGDQGANGIGCSEDRRLCGDHMPLFPATSPWATAVGGTMLAKANRPLCDYASDSVIVSCSVEGEVACEANRGGSITSGGGFSNDFPTAWYQRAAVDEYLKQTDSPLPPASGDWKYNPSGRAFPDISAIATNFLVWMGDAIVPISGTSASTPLMAAMIALLNEDRLQQGLPPLGFLNPLLYKLAQEHPEAFNDVVVGNNRCTTSHCEKVGFGAARGWDAVSGVGTPAFATIADLLRPQATRMASFGPAFGISAAVSPPPPASSAWFLLVLWTGALLGAGVVWFVPRLRRKRLVSLRAPLHDDYAAV